MNKLIQEEEWFMAAYERTNQFREVTKMVDHSGDTNDMIIARQFQKYTPPRLDRPLIMKVA